MPAGSIFATAVLPNQLPGRWAEFVFGMIAAELYALDKLKGWRLRYMAPVAITLVGLSILAVGNQFSHLFFGGVFFLLLTAVLKGDNMVAAAMSWRPLVALGTMSYSVYLVHQPVVQARLLTCC
jgi:peptidoglycan/LPS O-acetylase OafA/YrhL